MSESDFVSGLQRSQLFWMLDVAPALEHDVADLFPYIAAGLVGDGSDAFGFDDELSLDHDAETKVRIWIPEGVGGSGAAFRISAAVEARQSRLPHDLPSPVSTPSIEVFEISAFYRRYTGLDWSPHTWREWYAIPQHNLAAATNGAVFFDGAGRFTARREQLLAYYPLDVSLKLLESACLRMGQSGQYNYPRLRQRNEDVAAELMKAQFMQAALAAVFILNRRYKPFDKWAHRAVQQLPVLGEATANHLLAIAHNDDAYAHIEALSALIISEMANQNLSDNSSDFLVNHATTLRSRIIEPELREENPWKI